MGVDEFSRYTTKVRTTYMENLEAHVLQEPKLTNAIEADSILLGAHPKGRNLVY